MPDCPDSRSRLSAHHFRCSHLLQELSDILHFHPARFRGCPSLQSQECCQNGDSDLRQVFDHCRLTHSEKKRSAMRPSSLMGRDCYARFFIEPKGNEPIGTDHSVTGTRILGRAGPLTDGFDPKDISGGTSIWCGKRRRTWLRAPPGDSRRRRFAMMISGHFQVEEGRTVGRGGRLHTPSALADTCNSCILEPPRWPSQPAVLCTNPRYKPPRA